MTRRSALSATLAFDVRSFRAESAPRSAGRVRHYRLPNGGIQPQIVADDRGTLHVLYYSGESRHGNVIYTSSKDGGATISSPLQVNRAWSAVAAGTIRGAQIALGKGERVHGRTFVSETRCVEPADGCLCVLRDESLRWSEGLRL